MSIFRLDFFVLAVLVGLLPFKAKAAFSNYNSIVVGDQAAGMGGAGTSLVGDTSAMAYYNPALMSHVEGSSFSAAVGIYKKFDTLYGKDEDFRQAPLRVNQGFFQSIPASTGNVMKVYDYYLGMSIVVPDYDTYKGDLRKTDSGTTTYSQDDQSLWVGGAIAKSFNQNHSWGATLYYTARTASRSVNDRSFVDANNAHLYSSERSMTDNGVLAVLGYYYEGDEWALGFSARTPAVKISSSWNFFDSDTRIVGGTITNTPHSEKDFEGEVVIPAKLSFGVSHRWSDSLLLSMNLDAYEGRKYIDVKSSYAAVELEHLPTLNVSLGAEKALYPWLKFRAGVFTNFSSHPDPDSAKGTLQPDKVDMLGFSANVLLIANSQIGYTFGGYYTGGKGKSVQRIDHSLQTVTKTQQVFTMLVGTSFFF